MNRVYEAKQVCDNFYCTGANFKDVSRVVVDSNFHFSISDWENESIESPDSTEQVVGEQTPRTPLKPDVFSMTEQCGCQFSRE